MNIIKKIWSNLSSFFSSKPEDYKLFDSAADNESKKTVAKEKKAAKTSLKREKSAEAVSTKTVDAKGKSFNDVANRIIERPEPEMVSHEVEDSTPVVVEEPAVVKEEETEIVLSEDVEEEAFTEEDEIVVESEEEKPVEMPEAKPEPAVAVQPAVSVASASTAPTQKRRYSPNEVNEQSAQRLARLLVSEIKLYYMNKAEEIPTDNLFDNLRGPIEKSRQHYRERMNAKGESLPDYFHQELVKSLCGGDESKLGPNYFQ